MFKPGYYRNTIPHRDWHRAGFRQRPRNFFRWVPPYPRIFRHR